MKAQLYFLCWLGTLIWYSKLLSAAVIMRFCLCPLSTCHTKIPQAFLSLPGLWVPAAHLNLSLLSGPQSHQRTEKVGHRESIAHTHTHTLKCCMNCGKKYTLCDRGHRVRQHNICCYPWAAALNGAFSDSSKPPFLQGNSGCIVTVLIRTASCLFPEIHPASTSKLCSE